MLLVELFLLVELYVELYFMNVTVNRSIKKITEGKIQTWWQFPITQIPKWVILIFVFVLSAEIYNQNDQIDQKLNSNDKVHHLHV